jgi:hypothetical protein
MSRLLEDRTKHDGETFYCYTTKGLLDTHIIDCKPHGAQKVTFPQKEENQWINFTSIKKQLNVPKMSDISFSSSSKQLKNDSTTFDPLYTFAGFDILSFVHFTM